MPPAGAGREAQTLREAKPRLAAPPSCCAAEAASAAPPKPRRAAEAANTPILYTTPQAALPRRRSPTILYTPPQAALPRRRTPTILDHPLSSTRASVSHRRRRRRLFSSRVENGRRFVRSEENVSGACSRTNGSPAATDGCFQQCSGVRT